MIKGLEAFKEIREYLDYIFYGKPGTRAIGYTSTSGYLEPFMTVIEKGSKALDIINEKRVDISWFYYSDDIDKYHSIIDDSRRYLTQEEFDLFKEVLNYD